MLFIATIVFIIDTYTTKKTTATISLSQPSEQSPTNSIENISFETKTPNDAEPKSIVREEVQVSEHRPVHSQFSGFDLLQNEPEDIVFTEKKTTSVTKTVESSDEPRKSLSKEITLEKRLLNPKTDLISWDEEVVDKKDDTFFKDSRPKEKEFLIETKREDIKPVKKPRKEVKDEIERKPEKKPREGLSDDYQGSLARAERKLERKDQIKTDDIVDGYKGSLNRNINRTDSFNRGRNEVILHDIESDLHVRRVTPEPERDILVMDRIESPSPIKVRKQYIKTTN